MLYFLSAIAGGVVIAVPWWLMARTWDRLRDDLLSENGDLSQRLSEVTYWRGQFQREADRLRAEIASSPPQPRDQLGRYISLDAA